MLPSKKTNKSEKPPFLSGRQISNDFGTIAIFFSVKLCECTQNPETSAKMSLKDKLFSLQYLTEMLQTVDDNWAGRRGCRLPVSWASPVPGLCPTKKVSHTKACTLFT